MNQYKPHIVILPEDDANRQIANGFLNNLNVNFRSIKILHSAGGCRKVPDTFAKDIISKMRKYSEMLVILLIDFDAKENPINNFTYAKSKVPEDLKDRVFVLGVFSEPEKLRKEIGSYEKIGEKLAEDCYDDTNTLWQHDLLNHNQDELQRIYSSPVKQIIFN
jgi:hypothetical protein